MFSDNKNNYTQKIDKFAIRATRSIGSNESLIVHTGLFLLAFLLVLFGISFERVLLVLTTIVSLEAIYLSIFIQMSVNRTSRRLQAVSRDIDEIQKDVEGISEDIDEIQKDVEGIEKDVEDIQEGVEGIEKDVDELHKDIEDIGDEVEEWSEDDEKEAKKEAKERKSDVARFERIENSLGSLLEEIKTLKVQTNDRSTTTKLKK